MLFFLFAILLPYPLFLFFIAKFHSVYCILMAIHCFLLAYIVTLLVGLIKNKAIRSVVQYMVVFLAAVLFALNVYCLVEFQGLLDVDYLMLILNTNVNEAREFLTSVLRKSILFSVGGVFLFFYVLWLLSRHYHLGIESKWCIPVLFLLVVLLVVNPKYWKIWRDGPVFHISYLLYSIPKYQIPDDLDLGNNTNPDITFNVEYERPANMILIIGESFSRSHSSLYGYNMPTNPRLGALKDSTMLFTFDSIEASDGRTSKALQLMLGLCTRIDLLNEDKKWYEYTTLIEVMHESGYDSYWYSNQERTGMYNAAGRVLAQSCNHVSFSSNKGYSIFDEALVDSSYQTVHQMDSGYYFVIYHLMGSHFDYSSRYPKKFEFFSENDYTNREKDQRKIVATYDNSILYNDYVVEQIINLFRHKEAVIVYLPDHGQDMFESSPDYFMHGKHNDPVSWSWGLRIPFMVYASPLYQKHYPDVIKRFQERQNHPKPWNSEDLPYFIMDLIGLQTINGEAVKSRSVL